MQIRTDGHHLSKSLKEMVRRTKDMYKSYVDIDGSIINHIHLNLARSLSVNPVVDVKLYGKLMALMMIYKMRMK